MPDAARKPLAVLESREPKSIRFTPSEWESINFEARLRGLEPAVFVRRLTLIALNDVTRLREREASLGIPSMAGAGAPRTSRFSRNLR